MPTLFDTLTGPPARATAGAQESWTEDFADYANASYNVRYVLTSNTPVDGYQSETLNGVESGTVTRTFTMPAGIKPGVYDYVVQIVRQSDSAARAARRGCIIVAPDPTAEPTVTDAQNKVTALETAVGTLNSATNQSVSFNGQSFTKANAKDLQAQLTYWQSRVLREQRLLAQLTTAVAESECCDCDC